jgi:hypothetical protein
VLGAIHHGVLVAFAAGSTGKINDESGPFPLFAFHFNGAGMLFNDGVTHGKPQSRPLIFRLGGKKGIE